MSLPDPVGEAWQRYSSAPSEKTRRVLLEALVRHVERRPRESTLRTIVAALVLAGIRSHTCVGGTTETLATEAVESADALLAVLKRKKGRKP